MEKVEFGSDAWVRELRRIIDENVTQADLAGVEFSICEEYTDPPAHLRRAGRDTIGWHLRVRDGKVEVVDEPSSDVDVHIVTDYVFILPRAREVHGDVDDATRAARIGELLGSGKFRMEGTLGSGPDFLGRINLHDRLAAITA